MNSEYFTSWDEYKTENPKVADVEDVCTVGDYQDDMYRFVFDLFL